MKCVLLVPAILLAGCADPVDDAEREMTLVNQYGTPDQKCAARRKLAQAYLTANRGSDYEIANLGAEAECSNLRLERQLGITG